MSDKIREALAGVLAIVGESRGVDGYHLNGDIAEWDEFPEVEAARAAIALQPAPAVPDGWKLVPVEPTKEMIVAGKEAHWDADNAAASGNDGFAQFGRRVKRAAHVYRAMLAAAPAAPVAQEPATWVSVSDGLPGEDSEVIVSGWAYNDPARGRFVTHADFSDGQFKPVGAADEYDLHPPTHWMPMPSAPGEAAPPAAEQLAQSAPDELRARCDGGTCGLGEVCENCMMADAIELAAEQPDTVAVPRELLERAVDRLAHGHELDKACRELRALLAGGAE